MFKIGICGTSCSGKTTLCYELLAQLKRAGRYAATTADQDRDFPVPSGNLKTSGALWSAFVGNQIALEMKKEIQGVDVLVCDRTPLDTYAHGFVASGGLGDIAPLLDYCIYHMTSYDRIYLTTPKTYKIDSVRGPEDDRIKVDTVVRDLSMSYPSRFRVLYETDIPRDTFISTMLLRTEKV